MNVFHCIKHLHTLTHTHSSFVQETVSGEVVIESKGSLSHQGIQLVMEGNTTLQLSAKSVGLFEAFYSSLKPIQVSLPLPS